MANKNTSVLKFNKELKYSIFTPAERQEWKNYDVNIESFCDKWFFYKESFELEINKLNESQIEEVCRLYKLKKLVKHTDYYEVLRSNTRCSVEFFAIIEFSRRNALIYSRIFNIPKKGIHINRPELWVKLLKERLTGRLESAFMTLIIHKNGTAKYIYNLSDNLPNIIYDQARKILQNLCAFLKRKDGKKYHLRFNDKIGSSYYFLLVKEAADSLYVAIPQNARVLKGSYLLVSIDIGQKKLHIHTLAWKEALHIKNYLGKRLKTSVSYLKETVSYNAEDFFNPIINKTLPDSLQLYQVNFRKHNIGDSTFDLVDTHKKNSIIDILISMKDKRMINLSDFAEFKSFSFRYQNQLIFRINLMEDKWGRLKIALNDSRKPAKELLEFKQIFEKLFNMPIGKFLTKENALENKAVTASKLLDLKTIDSKMPAFVEEVLLDLVNDKIILKPLEHVKRKCVNCSATFWTKGDCPSCGYDAYFEGEFFDINPDIKAVYRFIEKTLKKPNSLTLKKIAKQIDSTKFQLLDIFDKSGKSISLLVVANNVSPKIISYFRETGNPLLVILMQFKAGIQNDILSKGFSCIHFPSLYYSKDALEFQATIENEIQKQHDTWKDKLLEKGYSSFNNYINRNEKYYDQNFEKDIYNILHEMFLVGDRLGGKFTGVEAPDGIISIQDYDNKIKRFCFAWDCKYSTSENGYNLTDKPSKHRHYINVLSHNDKVIFYGGLKTYAIISQNMNEKAFETFYKKLTKNFSWNGQVIFIEANDLIHLYKIFRDNYSLISNYPQVFYRRIYAMFKDTVKRDVLPVKKLTLRRIQEVLILIQNDFEPLKKSFEFTRHEFKK